MIIIISPWLIKALTFYTKGDRIDAKSFFIFLIFKSEKYAQNKALVDHEKVHFYQQLELLFIGQWLLYSAFYLIERFKGLNHWDSYRNNPFEKEAYLTKKQPDYLKNRKLYAWTKHIWI